MGPSAIRLIGRYITGMPRHAVACFPPLKTWMDVARGWRMEWTWMEFNVDTWGDLRSELTTGGNVKMDSSLLVLR